MNLLEKIRDENLNVYKASPQRLQEDVGQEGEIAQNYRGRLIYELMQNADDAMGDEPSNTQSIRFMLTDSDLWVANSGRPLTEADVRGLCGISASNKITLNTKRRASIGHKGMGFKSVLEITDAPEVYSTTTSFRFSKTDALRAVQPLIKGGYISDLIKHTPITRFPRDIQEDPQEWCVFREMGMNTVFRFPLRSEMSRAQRGSLSHALKTIPVTSLIFLRNLDRIEVEIKCRKDKYFAAWTVKRQRNTNSGWIEVAGLPESGGYQVTLDPDVGESETFLLAHDADLLIGNHRGGLNEVAWDGIDNTEVSLAVRLQGGRLTNLLPEWKKFHVFLPTLETVPYNILVNGAFSSSLSRQEIRVENDASNYNRFLLHEAARILRDMLIPLLKTKGIEIIDCLRLLNRGVSVGTPCSNSVAQALFDEVRAAIINSPLIPSEQGDLLTIGSCAVPPLVPDSTVGRDIRLLLPTMAVCKGRKRKLLPDAECCGAEIAHVLADHGAHCLTPEEVSVMLANSDPVRSRLVDHRNGKLSIDPVLEVLERLWQGFDSIMREQLVSSVRNKELFPDSIRADGVVRRISTAGLTCFYPPRSLGGEMPLSGLCFLLQDLCWGTLTPQERNFELRQQMEAWKALFDIREFKFPEVMRASVLPELDLDRKIEESLPKDNARKLLRLAAICQLSGRTPNSKAPLPYERLGSNRALFNLSRLEVPCRGSGQDDIVWVPAYQAYFGIDWIGERSVEQIVLVGGEITIANLPEINFVIARERLNGLLDKYRHLSRAGEDDNSEVGSDEVSLDEDDESVLDHDDYSRWLHFFLWLGVNQSLRPVHFHDVEDRASGWTSTCKLKRPNGWAFRNVPDDIWDRYVRQIEKLLEEADKDRLASYDPYFYRLHSLEHLQAVLNAATRDSTARLGRALYEHLALNWSSLEGFSQTHIALIPQDQQPTRRSNPPSAKENEIVDVGPDYWMVQLRDASFCPTSHGPRQATKVWWPTPEVKRRFARRASHGSYLIPVLDVNPTLLKDRARGFAQAIGIRDELSPATFTPDDARLLLVRLAELYKARCENGDDLRQDLREEIRPGYRNLFELLSGNDLSGEDSITDVNPSDSCLSDALLMAQNDDGQLSFLPAKDVFYVDRRDTKERLQLDSSIWSFIIEASPAARFPLIKTLGVRELESSLSWSPSPGEPALDEEGRKRFQNEFYEIAPYLLARMGTDREVERLVNLDARRLSKLIDIIEPVKHLGLSCRLDGRDCEISTVNRDAFVLLQNDSPVQAFIVWGENPWPPDPVEAEALVSALCDVFGSRYFESFLALITASTTETRKRILRRAGAPLDIEEKRSLLKASNVDIQKDGLKPICEVEDPKSVETVEFPEQSSGLFPESRIFAGSDGLHRLVLYKPEDLLVEGLPITVFGNHAESQSVGVGMDASGTHNRSSAGGNGIVGYGGRTDLEALNDLGMWIAMSFECNRLKQSGIANAKILDLSWDIEQPDAVVFDLTKPDKIELGRKLSKPLDQALKYLHKQFGVSLEWPGFDVMSIDPSLPNLIDRLIELKSSGVASRVLEMSWNEWKTACESTLCKHFYLYLVGNLRADLIESEPFIRTFCNPFEQLRADVSESQAIQRKVQLSVYDFDQADELKLSLVHNHKV